MMWTNFPLMAAVVDAAAEHGEGVFKMSSPEFNILYKKATKLYKAEGGTGELSKNCLLTRRQIGSPPQSQSKVVPRPEYS
jgi:hypothetical protein